MATYYYVMSGSNVVNTVTSVTSSTLTGSTSAAAMNASKDNWTAGDEIYLDPSGGAFPVSPSVSWPAGITVYYRGSTITAAPSSATEGTFFCSAPSKHIGPMFIRNTHSTVGRAIYIKTSGGHLHGIYMRDVTVLQCPNPTGYGPIEIEQDKTNQYTINGQIDNLTMELTTEGGYRDVVGFADNGTGWTHPDVRGHFVLVNPRLGYATSSGGSGGGTSNNLISHDARMDVHVFGGVLHDAGGRLAETVNDARLFLYGVRGYNATLNASAYSTSQGAVYCTQAYDCEFWNVGHGIQVGPPDLCTTGFGDNDEYVIENCKVTRHQTKDAGTEASNIFAYHNIGRICRVTNCVSVGYGVSGASYYNGFFYDTGPSGPTHSVEIEGCRCDNAYRAVFVSGKEGSFVLRKNIFRQAPSSNTLDPFLVAITGAGSSNKAIVTLDGNTFDSRPASATNPEPVLNGGDGTTVTVRSVGNNYLYSNGNNRGANLNTIIAHSLARQALGAQTSQLNNQVKVTGLTGKATSTDGYVGAVIIIENQSDASDIQYRHCIDHEVVASVYPSGDTVACNRPFSRQPVAGDYITIAGVTVNMHLGSNDIVTLDPAWAPTYTNDGYNSPTSPVVTKNRSRLVSARTETESPIGSYGVGEMMKEVGTPGIKSPDVDSSRPASRRAGA